MVLSEVPWPCSQAMRWWWWSLWSWFDLEQGLVPRLGPSVSPSSRGPPQQSYLLPTSLTFIHSNMEGYLFTMWKYLRAFLWLLNGITCIDYKFTFLVLCLPCYLKFYVMLCDRTLSAQYSAWRRPSKQHFLCLCFICGFTYAGWNKRGMKALSLGITCMRSTIMMWSWEYLRLGLVILSMCWLQNFKIHIADPEWVISAIIGCKTYRGYPTRTWYILTLLGILVECLL